MLTPFVDLSAGRQEERLATSEEKKMGHISPDLLKRSPAELQRRFRKERVGVHAASSVSGGTPKAQ
jgi:hypothetical protein